MNEQVLQETIDLLRKARSYIPDNIYRDEYLPLIFKLKEELAVIRVERAKQNDFHDTVPQTLQGLVSRFGIFKD